jgi:hypothetical protein
MPDQVKLLARNCGKEFTMAIVTMAQLQNMIKLQETMITQLQANLLVLKETIDLQEQQMDKARSMIGSYSDIVDIQDRHIAKSRELNKAYEELVILQKEFIVDLQTAVQTGHNGIDQDRHD